MYKLVLVRHGESVWNKENKFTGWTDVDLSEKGEGQLLVPSSPSLSPDGDCSLSSGEQADWFFCQKATLLYI